MPSPPRKLSPLPPGQSPGKARAKAHAKGAGTVLSAPVDEALAVVAMGKRAGRHARDRETSHVRVTDRLAQRMVPAMKPEATGLNVLRVRSARPVTLAATIRTTDLQARRHRWPQLSRRLKAQQSRYDRMAWSPLKRKVSAAAGVVVAIATAKDANPEKPIDRSWAPTSIRRARIAERT